MLENEAKGWHGNYSIIGRNIVERFQLILKKDEILSGKMKKKYVSGFNFGDEVSEDNKKNRKNKDVDIFSDNYDKQMKEKLKIKNEEKKIMQAELCTSKTKYDVKEKYKYHQSHHSDLITFNDKLVKIKEKNGTGLANYNPKKDFVWKKVITGPHWELLKGRKNSKNNISLNKDRKGKGGNFYLTHKAFESNSITMDKQTKRGALPTFYDLRIRTDKPFLSNDKIKLVNNSINSNTSETINNNNSIKNKNSIISVKEKISKTPNKSKFISIYDSNNNNAYLNTYTNSFSSKKVLNKGNLSRNKNIINNTHYKLKLRKRLEDKNLNCSSMKETNKNSINHTIDFSKTLPRDLNFFLHNKGQVNHPISNPSYKLIEPRCITMVSYAKKIKGKASPKKFVGVNPHIFFDPDKVINKVNNHKETIAPNFNIMTGRNFDSGPLPSFMVGLFDRKSVETMTYKGLKMNNYANVDFQNNYSTFHPKKSFNKVINYTLLNNDKESIDEELKLINKEIYGNKKLEKLIEGYSSDNTNKEYNENQFDAITLKSIKRSKDNSVRNKPLAFRF